MKIHDKFPESPHEIIKPEFRWRPEDDEDYKLLPPLVLKIRKSVYEWRNNGYEGASDTSKMLLNHWFNNKNRDFQYYFAQREAVESVIYLYEVAKAHTPEMLMQFQNYELSKQDFKERWIRYVLKLATGTGKTKVLSLIITWAYFHKLYEKDSKLSKNFLLITPNIIVLDRLRSDFESLKIFFSDSVIPENGYEDRNWFDDFQMDVHIQDNVRINKAKGNLFLTNIHRVYYNDKKESSFEDEDTKAYFLGPRAKDAKEDQMDLGKIVREIDELIVLNDEAHHIRDNKWAEAINDLNNHLIQKDKELSLQIDVTATPKFDKGKIFPQTICDYPLVEAIKQNVVKHPLLPDGSSQSKCVVKKSVYFVEEYKDFIDLGVAEWKEGYEGFMKVGKKPILFIMVPDTKNCDDVATYLEKNHQDLKGAVLSIHTRGDGEIGEGKNNAELESLRQAANTLDDLDNPYKVVVSVLVLKEGWDVKNVTTIVGLRAFAVEDNVLAEQTLGRGLRKMGLTSNEETVSVIGTENFISFIETLGEQGVEFDKKAMGSDDEDEGSHKPILIEVDKDNKKKDIENLDIEIPLLTPRIYRSHDRLGDLDVSKILSSSKKIKVNEYGEDEIKEIIFERALPSNEEEREHHRLVFDTGTNIDVTNLIRWFVREIKIELRLGQVEHILYSKLKSFIEEHLFESNVDLKDRNIVRNLSDLEVKSIIFKDFIKAINELTVLEKNSFSIRSWLKVSDTKPFYAQRQEYVKVKKSPFNKITGDSKLELDVATLLDNSNDIVSFAKNYLATNFRLDYQNIDKEISNYIPDFFIKKDNNTIYILETKGIEVENDKLKFNRLVGWCSDVNAIKENKYEYIPLYVKEDDFRRFEEDIKNFSDLVKIGRKEKFEF